MGLAIVAIAATAPAGASTAKPSGCDSINLGEPRVFYKSHMRCKKAKHYARRLYKTDGDDRPRKFTCESGSNFNEGGSCRHDFKPKKYFGWHPAD